MMNAKLKGTLTSGAKTGAWRRTHMWMAVYLISALLFKLGVEFMRLNLLVVDSPHIHTS